MGVVERSSANVESYIAMLEEAYSVFSINQTTVSASQDQYGQAREAAREDRVDVYAKVRNENSEVLHVQKEDTLALPSTTIAAEGSLEYEVCSTVEDWAGIECSITGVEQATILGITNAEDDDCGTIYRLAVLFEGVHEAGSLEGNAVWQQTVTPPQPIEV
jgi:hypothetical protein